MCRWCWFDELKGFGKASYKYLLPYTKMYIFWIYRFNKINGLQKYIFNLLNLGCIRCSEMRSKRAGYAWYSLTRVNFQPILYNNCILILSMMGSVTGISVETNKKVPFLFILAHVYALMGAKSVVFCTLNFM